MVGAAAIAALLVLVFASGWALLGSERGTAWLLRQLPGVEVTAPRGAMLGDRLTAERLVLRWQSGSGTGTVTIDDLALQGLRWQALPAAGLWAALRLDAATARRVQVAAPPSSGEPWRPPATLHSPVALAVTRLRIDELQVADAAPLRDLHATLAIGGDGGRRHTVEDIAFGWDRVAAHDGRLAIASVAPFTLDATLRAHAGAGLPWQAEAQLRGPLDRLALAAALHGEPRGPGQPAPALDATVELRPFEPWPLGPLALSTRSLDLAALSRAAPATRLDGEITVTTRGANQPAQARITLDNALPGRWDQGRAPLRRLRATLQADRSQPEHWDAPDFELQLADGRGDAGRWLGRAALAGRRLSIDSRLVDLRPQRLDGRAAAMRLGGPITLRIDDLPVAGGPGWLATRMAFEGRLEGALDDRPQPVELVFEGRAAADGIELSQLRASAGDASAQAALQLQRDAGQRWQLRSHGELLRFDPLPWLPAAEGAPWRRGAHRLNGSWTLALTLPDRTLRLPPLQWLQTLHGEGELRLTDSTLAGLPLRAELTLAHDRSAPVAERSRARGRVELAGNVLAVDGSGDPLGSGAADRWTLDLQAPQLAALAPLAAWVPDLAEWAPRRGAVAARLSARGRWPDLQTEGEAGVQALQLGTLALAQAQVRWRLDTADVQTLDLQADLTGLAYGSQRVDALRGQARGTLAAHRLSVELTTPVAPPAWLERIFALPAGRATRLRLDGDGAWSGAEAGGGRWRGRVERLTAGVAGTAGSAVDAGAPPDAGRSAAWLDTGDLQAELQFDRDGRLVAVAAPAGRAMLAGGIALRWSALDWQADPAAPALALRAEIEPFAVAPLLQNWQDGAGVRNGTRWSGDLRVGAHLDLRAGTRFDAELQLLRHGGDLAVSDGGTPQALGLDVAEFTLSAHEGVWRFTPRFTGRTLGALAGELTAHTTPQARWPGPQSRLEGAVGAEVPNLAVWTGWLPPGWRIDGQLALGARLAGTLGAPETTGELNARGIGVRNLLQGVALSEGEFRVALQGARAQVERLAIRAGDGTLSATGEAQLGATPRARLDVRAEKFRLLGRVDRQLVLSGRSTLALQAERLTLDGRLVVDRGLFDLSARDAPTLDEDVNVRRDGAVAAVRPEAAPVPPLLRNAAVALDIDLGRDLRLRGRGLDTRLAGQLQLGAPGGRLAVHGTVQAEDGTYAAYGQKLEIERGLVIFAGPLDGARLDILALRPNIDLRVGVAITGTALNPRVRLVSEPEMSETDKLSWLVMGRGPDGLGRTDTALLQRAAVALLAGEGAGPTDALVRALGLDDLSVRQSDGEVRETVISVGKQLSRRWYVGYERAVNATSGTWQLVYRIAQRFTLRAQSGLENSLDLIWTWRYGLPAPRP